MNFCNRLIAGEMMRMFWYAAAGEIPPCRTTTKVWTRSSRAGRLN